EIAAERRHEAAALDRHAARLVHLDDRMLAGELLRHGAILVAHQEFFRRAELDGTFQRQPVLPQSALKSLVVEPQRRIGDVGFWRDAVHDVLGVGHAGHCLRIDEGDDLDLVDAGLRQRVDQRDFARGRNGAFLELKTLARTFLADVYAFRQVAHCGSPTVTIERRLKASISVCASPSSAKTSAVCSPISGAWRRSARSWSPISTGSRGILACTPPAKITS